MFRQLSSKSNSCNNNDMIKAVSELSRIVNNSALENADAIIKDSNNSSLLDSHKNLVSRLSNALSDKEIELAKCRQNIKLVLYFLCLKFYFKLKSESDNLKFVSISLKSELDFYNKSHLNRIETLNRELSEKSSNKNSDLNSFDKQIPELLSKISSLESLLQIEKDDNIALKTTLSSLSNHKCYTQEDVINQIDKDSAIVRLSEQNDLLSKQISSLQSSIIFNSENKVSNLPCSDFKYSNIPTAEYVKLLLNAENLKLNCGKQANEIKFDKYFSAYLILGF